MVYVGPELLVTSGLVDFVPIFIILLAMLDLVHVIKSREYPIP